MEKDDIRILSQCRLFKNISEEEIYALKDCLSFYVKNYKSNEYILSAGDMTQYMGILLSGELTIVRDDFWGNRNIIAKVFPKQVFAETYACQNKMPLQVSVLSDTLSKVCFININKLMNNCNNNCTFHQLIIKNLIDVITEKNIFLNERLNHISQRSTKDKILSFLSSEAKKNKSNDFYIDYSRQAMANLLSVERTALSKELGKLQDEGYINYKKNHFILLKNYE